MESPFFSRTLSYRRSPRDIPVRHKESPEDYSVPIHYEKPRSTPAPRRTPVSEKSRAMAARGIQKVFRGFRVRKSMNKVMGIKREADEIEERISSDAMVDLIRENDKERLKMNEMLMALLLRLDSVRGFDSGVRDCRKAVTKKVIMLQERLDAIVAGEHAEVEEATEINDAVSQEDYLLLQEDPNPEDCAIAAEEDLTNQPEILDESDNDALEKKEEEAMEMEQSELIQATDAGVERHNENKELMERMMDKNDLLIQMVTELCERNKMQSQLITCLSKRVDDMEKVIKSERSKCKKRRQAAALLQ